MFLIRAASIRGFRPVAAQPRARRAAPVPGESAEPAAQAEPAELAALVRVMVDRTLPVAPVSIQATARTLAVHPRTLQRRLRAEGTSFAAIVDEVRRRNAHRYLTGTDLPLTRISTLLGFAEQATFTRSCRRWWGTTPTAVRRGRPGDGDGRRAALSATAP